MAVPPYQDLMLPLLRIAGDGNEHSIAEVMALLADKLKLTDEDRDAVLASGQTRFYNRVMWAETYLSKSGLIEKTGRARFKISPRGTDVLKKNPARIDTKFLGNRSQFPPKYSRLRFALTARSCYNLKDGTQFQ